MTVNLRNTPLDPKTGLPTFLPSGPAQATSKRLKNRAKAARDLADRLEAMLDEVTAEFETAFADADANAKTRARIADVAKTNRI